MTESMRALLGEPGRMVIEACEPPAPGPDEAVIKIARVGVRGSDIHGFGPCVPPGPGRSVGLGHEPSGVVVEVGRGVAGLGAGAAVNAREADVAGRIRQIVGRYGADVVFGTAGAAATVELGLAVVKRHGRILVVGTVPGGGARLLPQDQPGGDHPDGVPLLQQLSDDDRAHALGRPRREGLLGPARILAFGSIFNNPLISRGRMASLFRRARAAGMTVCADMVPGRAGAGLEDIAEALGRVEYFFPNADEAVELTGADDERRAAAVLSGSTSPTSRGGTSGPSRSTCPSRTRRGCGSTPGASGEPAAAGRPAAASRAAPS